MSQQTITLLFLVFTIISFILEKIPLGLTASICAIGLTLTGVVDVSTTFSQYVNSNVILCVGMFVVGQALFETGMANKIGGLVTKFARTEKTLIIAIMVIVGVMSGFLSNTGTAAVLIPVVCGIADESGYSRSRLLMPLVFVGIPFVVRTVQPILEKLDSTYEEAAGVLGASRIRIFWQVIFPEILPAALTGFGLAFGRCLGEYGSVVFIAGNQPYETEITPLIIMSKLQEYDYTSATSIALVMLVAAFLILFLTNLVQSRSSKILKGGQ